MPGTTSIALPSFSHDQHHKTDAAKRKGGGLDTQGQGQGKGPSLQGPGRGQGLDLQGQGPGQGQRLKFDP